MEENSVPFTENIYAEHLAAINGINFTPREIAVIACLLHARGTSRIASFLSIAPRTVVTHIRNIMLKLECNSRESIIDFIEKSHKIPTLRTYYERLVVESAFDKSLHEISKLRHEGSRGCILVYWADQSLKTALLHRLKNHLNRARLNAEVREQALDQKVEPLESLDHALLLLLEKKDQESIPEDFLTFDSIDLSEQKNYCFAVFEILKKLLPNVNLENILTNFRERSEGMIGGPSIAPSQISLEKEELNEFINKETSIINRKILNQFFQKRFWPLGWGILTILLLGAGFLSLKDKTIPLDTQHRSQKHQEQSIRSDLIVPVEAVLLQRPELLSQVQNKFREQKSGIQTLALVGIGGSGKTTAARHYAHKQKTSVIWEVNAETNTSLKESFEKLAYALSTTEEDKNELHSLQEIQNPSERERKLIDFVKRKLKSYPNWFLIYDNVEKFTDIQKYFPLDAETWGQGRIILTTRDSNIQNNKHINYTLHIGELNENQKLNLFAKIMNQEAQTAFTEGQTVEAKKFLREIPPFPLDVSLASYYIKTTNVSYDQYVDLLKKNDVGLTNLQETILKESGDYNKNRYSLVTLSLQKLIESHKDFEELLLFVGLLDSQNIPKELLNWNKKPDVVDNFIYHLKKHSLVTMQSSSFSRPTLSIHRSTQAIILAFLAQKLNLQEKDHHLLMQAIANSLVSYVEDELDKDDFLRGRQLISHLERFVTHGKLLNEAINASIDAEIAYIYYFFGHYVKTKEILERSYSILKKYYGEDHIKVGTVLFYLGMVERELGTYEKVQDNFEKSLKIYQKETSTHHARIATIIAFLGIIARDQGKYNKSKHELEKSLKIYEKNYSKNHIKIAWIVAQLGLLEENLGNYKKAKDLLEQSFITYKKYFGENHPESIWLLVNLGILYKHLGYYENAKVVFEKSLVIYEKHYSKEHINVAWILTNLGDTYGLLGDHKTAKELQERSVLFFRKNFPQNHKYHIGVAWALAHLGNSYKNLHKFEEAKLSLETSLQAYKKHYGIEHTETADRVLKNLGQVYLLEGNLKKAEEFLGRALTIFQKNNHPNAYTCLESFSDLYLKKSEEAADKNAKEDAQNFKTQAVNNLKKALDIVKTHFPEDSPHIIRIQDKIKKLSFSP